jgi:putative PEP-CTERM system TPR-repeat lipoprotein
MNKVVSVIAGSAIATVLLLSACQGNTAESYLESARKKLAANDARAAVIELKNALQKDPNLAEARFLLGETLLLNGDVASAEVELRKAAEGGFAKDRVLPALAYAMVAQGQFKKVVGEFGNVQLSKPEAMAALQTEIGNAQLAQHNASAAKAAYESATALVTDFPAAVVGEARLQALTGDITGALAALDTSLAKSSESWEAWRLKGDLELAARRPDEAVAAYRKAVALKPIDLRARGAIASILLDQGKREEAAKEVAAMKQAAPGQPDTLYAEAQLAYRQKNYEAARDLLQKQASMTPDDPQMLLLAGAVAYELKSYSQAEANLVRVVKAVPNQPFAVRMLAATYLKSGQSAKALDTLKPILPTIERDPEALALAAEIYMQNGKVQEAGRYFEKSAALNPKNTGARAAAALIHVSEGDVDRGFDELEQAAAEDKGNRTDLALIASHIQRGQFDDALGAIDALEKKRPEDRALTADLRGVVLLRKGDRDGARTNFDRAIELQPSFALAVLHRARMDIEDGNTSDADKRLSALLEKQPDSVPGMLALADLRAREHKPPAEIDALLAKAVAAGRTSTPVRLAVIGYYLRHGNPKQAATAAQEALTVLPDNPDIVEALGRAQLAAGETNASLATFGRLTQLRPDSPLAWVRLAQAQMVTTRDKAAATDSLRRALALKPDFLMAQQGMIELDRVGGDLKSAVATAREVQKQRPKESVGYVLEGDTYAYRKEWDAAIAAYRSGLKQVASTDLAMKLYAAYESKGDAAAGKFAASWVHDHPKDLVFRLFLAGIARDRKDYANAAKEYHAVLAARPDSAAVLNNLAWVTGQLHDPKAIDYAKRAHELAPNQPNIMDTFGMLLIEHGEVDRGVDLLRKAVVLAPGDYTIRFNFAKALIRTGQKNDARKELETLAKLGEKFPHQAEVSALIRQL